MDSDTEDTGVFSPPASKRNVAFDECIRNKQADVSETERTGVFSPDVSLRPRFVKSLDSLASKENTPPQTQTPSLNKQLESIEGKGGKRKHHFDDALQSQNSEDDSYDKVDVILDDLDNQKTRTKRMKRFKLSPEKSVDVSSSDDTDVLSLGTAIPCSQDGNKRKSRFVVSANITESEESANYSDVFKTASQESKKVERKRFVTPPSFQESDDSLLLVNAFKSGTKNKIEKQWGNRDNMRYGEELKPISQNDDKMKRKPRFAQPSCSQESEDSLQYSDVSLSVSKGKNKNIFAIPYSQESEDSRQYSDIFDSTSNKPQKVTRNNRFISQTLKDNEESLGYSDISVFRNVSQCEKKNRFVDPASQEVEDSLTYSNLLLSQNEPNGEKKQPFVDPTSQEMGNSQGYSSVSISQNETNGEEKRRFIDPTSQEINSPSYSNVLVSQTEPNVGEKRRFIDPLSQETGDSLHYSDINISNGENERASQSLNDTFTLNLSSLSDCNPGKTDDCSASCENPNENDGQQCEKTSSTDFTFVRSICIDTIRSSFDISAPSSTSGITGKPINLTYDVPASVSCQQKDDSLANINLPDGGELKIDSQNMVPVISTLNMSCERTLVGSYSLEDANENVTLIESKNESSNTQESSSAVNECESQSATAQETDTVDTSENESKNAQDSGLMADESGNKSSDVEESSLMADESENRSTDIQKSISTADISENENSHIHESIPATDKSKNENSVRCSDINSNSVQRDITESNVTPAISVQSIMIDTIPNSSNAAQPDEKIIEESVYVPFNPSSLMLSVTVIEASSNTHRDFSIGRNGSIQIESVLPDTAQNNESSSPALLLTEKNIKEHDYAAVQISNAEEIVETPVTNLIDPPTEKSSNASGSSEIPAHSDEDIAKESSEVVAQGIPHVPFVAEIANKSFIMQTDAQSNEEIGKETVEPPTDTPSTQKHESPILPAQSIPNDVEPAKETPPPNISAQSRKSSGSRKSFVEKFPEPITPIVKVISPSSPQLSPTEEELKKSSAVFPTNVAQSPERTITPNDSVPKSNYSLRSRKSRSSDVQKSPESVRSTSAAAFHDASIDNSGDGFFHFSTAANSIPSRKSSVASSRKENNSRSRSSTSSSTQNFRTFTSTSSVSMFSRSEIGRPSVPANGTASEEFKVPQIPKPKGVSKPKKKQNDSFKHLPSRPNFPQFDFYCNKRFYDYLTKKMEPKYGIRTNNEAVKLAKYISEVVKEVIAMKTGDHHILVEEMKKVLFQKGIISTHYNFYIFCMDYMSPWFRRKAVPMKLPTRCAPNVEFDLQLLFDSIE